MTAANAGRDVDAIKYDYAHTQNGNQTYTLRPAIILVHHYVPSPCQWQDEEIQLAVKVSPLKATDEARSFHPKASSPAVKRGAGQGAFSSPHVKRKV